MDTMSKLGRLCFAISIAFFGVQYLLYGHFEGGLPLVPPWTPGAPVLAYVLGAALILAGLSTATLWNACYSAISLRTLLLLSFLFLHCLHASSILHNDTDRARAFECLTLSSIAFVLVGILPLQGGLFGSKTVLNKPVLFGRMLFAISMIVFGTQHFMYAAFIATLTPAWIPLHLFWFYFTGIGFIVAHPRNGDEWTSAFVALAVSNGSLLVAAAFSKNRNQVAS
jgi:uncharacterized membrane protein